MAEPQKGVGVSDAPTGPGLTAALDVAYDTEIQLRPERRL
jgi:hypothetical protein